MECAFGMLVRRWSILRGQITIALVVALAKLHNFCINEEDEDIPVLSPADELQNDLRGGVSLSQENDTLVPRALTDGGHHDDDFGTYTRP